MARATSLKHDDAQDWTARLRSLVEPSPTIRLTLAYVIILLVLSVTLSAVLYRFADAQLEDSLRNQYMRFQPTSQNGSSSPGATNPSPQFNPKQIQAELVPAREDLLVDLIYFNIFVMIAGTVLSYGMAKRTIRPIEQALEAQTRFTADASHELRTPLSVMQTGIETFRRNPAATKEEAIELLDSNLEEVSKLRGLSEALLKLARSDSQPLVLNSVDLSDITGAAISRVYAQAKLKKITVINDVSNVKALGDESNLVELTVILLDNAIKYSSPQTAVTVTGRKLGKIVELSVTDQGRGIAAKDLPHIFERFYRADASRSNANVEGHGLGLSIAREIAKAHQATLRVNSSPGKGTTFTVALASP
jgi:signal transduction histidine kinase